MEAVVLIGLLGAGYLYNKDTNGPDRYVTSVKHPEKNVYTSPNGENVYESNFVNEFSDKAISKDIGMSKMKQVYDDSLKPDTRVIGDMRLKGTIKQDNKLSNELKKNVEGFGEYDHLTLSSASGNYIDPNEFLSNDQGVKPSPFFSGAGINTNLDDTRKLNTHQGGKDFYQNKKELGQFFQQTKNLGNVFGNRTDYEYAQSKQRYDSGIKRTNELPFTQERVSHINIKDNINGDIGRLINEKRSIDNLRTKTNPKLTYGGKVLSGKGISGREQESQVFKHNPDKFFENSPDKWFVTNGAYLEKSERPEHIMKDTNRMYLNKQEMGPASPAIKEGFEERPKFKKSTNQQFGTDTMRNLGTETSAHGTDLQQQGYRSIPNEREVTELRTYDSNISVENKLPTIGLQDNIKDTIKQTTINSKNNGYIQNTVIQETLGLQDNVKVTKKQTTINSKNNGNIFGGYQKQTVGHEAPETTTKDSTMFEYTGNAGAYIHGDMSKENYSNAETNPTKEIIAQGREPTLSNTKLTNGMDTINMDIKKLDNDYLNHRINGVDKVYQEIPTDTTCELTTMKDKLDDSSIADRIDPNLLNPFRNNPFTQPLDSFAY